MDISERLQQLINDSGLELKEVADAVWLAPPTVSSYLTGKTKPNADTIIRLCKFFNVSADYLLDIPDMNSKSSPLYWDKVTSIYKEQRRKGMHQYGQGLEDNHADIITRILYLQEELVDALMYCEWIKDKLEVHDE